MDTWKKEFREVVKAIRHSTPEEGYRIMKTFRASQVRPGPLDDRWYGGFGGAVTSAGMKIDEKSALKFSPVYAAVKRISESIASLPLNLYRITGRNKEKAIDHPLYRILHLQPNPEQTRIQVWEALTAHLLLWGNCYAQIQRNLMGNIIALWPLDPSRMTPKRENDLLVYKYNVADTGEMITFPFWEILHVAGLSFNGLIGYSVIGLMRETIGRGLAQEEYQSRFYSQGANPSGILETDGTLGDEALEDLRKWFNATYGGISKSQQVMILQQGLKFHALTIPQRDAQFLETHKFTVRDVARWFLIPPHMIGDLERATWGNIESQSIDFVVYTLRPWLVRFEQAMEVKFNLGESYEIRHVVEGLLRGDSTARTALYNGAITNGWMNRNEVRELEDRNPVEGLDEFLTPSRAVSTPRDGGNGNGEDKDLQKKLYEMLGRTNRELGDIRKHLNLVERKV